MFDGPSFDLLPPPDDVLVASEVDVSRDQVVQALVVEVVTVVIDEACGGLLEMAG